MKRVLIISPHFPPVNAADMHRVRQSLPYFKQLGWEPVVIAVDPAYTESYSNDPLLNETIPADVEVHKVKALPVKYTRKLGLGSLSMRSYFHIRKKGNELLRKRKFDLVYFSTTAFHVMALGPYWKKNFNLPFIVDIQDPWRNDFYLDKPKNQRPPKFFIAYNIDKYLEAKTIPLADGIISVSPQYCETFIKRYPSVKADRCRVITFGIGERDIEVMRQKVHQSSIRLPKDKINLVYVGRGGHDMRFATEILFGAIAQGVAKNIPLFDSIHCWFIGTSYAPAGTGKPTIAPIAGAFNIAHRVTEITDRQPYFETLYLLDQADILCVPGSTDTAYTASKIYPYLVLEKKILAIFNNNSSVTRLLNSLQYGELISFENNPELLSEYIHACYESLCRLLASQEQPILDQQKFAPYKALAKTRQQVDFFNEVVV